MEYALAFVRSTTEYQAWGWNLTTSVFIGTVAITFLVQLPATIDQLRKAMGKGSADGLDSLMPMALANFYASFLIYGFASRNMAAIINALVLMPLFALIVRGALRKNGVRLRDKVALAGMAVYLSVYSIFWQEGKLYLLSVVVVNVALLMQPIHMVLRRSSAGCSLVLVIAFSFVCVVWGAYGWFIDDELLLWPSLVSFILYSWIAGLWFKYRGA